MNHHMRPGEFLVQTDERGRVSLAKIAKRNYRYKAVEQDQCIILTPLGRIEGK